MSQPSPSPDIEQGITRTAGQLQRILNQMEEEGYDLRKLDRLDQQSLAKLSVGGNVAGEEIALLKKIDPEINGNVDRLLSDLLLYRQETETKKKWTAWEMVKSIPGKIWGTVKRHPYLSTAVILGLLVAAAYSTGLGGIAVGRVKDWIASALAKAGIGEAAKTVAGAAEGATKAAESVIKSIPQPPVPPALPATPLPAPPPLPRNLPGSIDDALKILEGLERAG